MGNQPWPHFQNGIRERLIVIGLPKNKVGKCIKSIHICHLWVLTGFSAESEKNLCLGNCLNLKLNTRVH